VLSPIFPCCFPNYGKLDETTHLDSAHNDTPQQQRINILVDVIKPSKDDRGIIATSDQIVQVISKAKKVSSDDGNKHYRFKLLGKTSDDLKTYTFELIETDTSIKVREILFIGSSSETIIPMIEINGLQFKDFNDSENGCIIL
jgi:hypothetical protein